jgi:predicted ArsR family transcriptional regulator
MGWIGKRLEEWHGSITKEAIAEAVGLSRQAFLEHLNKYALESSVARTFYLDKLNKIFVMER